MSEQTATPNTRQRFKGELKLDQVTPEAPVTRGGIDLSEFETLIQRSWGDGGEGRTALGATVESDLAASFTENRLRQAAAKLNLGVKVTRYDAKSERGKELNLSGGQVRVVWEAKQKSARKPKAETNGSSAAPVAASSGVANPVPAETPASTGLPKPPARPAGKK